MIQAENYSSLFNDDIDNNNNNERHLENGSIDGNGNESKSNENDQQQQREIIEDNNNNVDESFDEFLLGDQILPILGSGDNGDVNDLFDELELLLSVSFFVLSNLFILFFQFYYFFALILRTEIDNINYYY